MKKYLKIAIALLHCLPTIIMPMRTKPINFDTINTIINQQKAAEKALEYKKAGQLIPDNVIAVLGEDIKERYISYNQCLKGQQSQSS